MVIDQITDYFRSFDSSMLVKFVGPVLTILVGVIIYFIVMGFIKRSLLKRSKKKTIVHNVNVYINVLNYIFVILLVVFVIFYTTGNILAFGVTAGLVSAALGWALQRPITGIAAWLMVVVKRPFIIGDRILVSHMKGDVIDITLTHIYLKEVGGTINSEETSGRIVMVPNSVLFEQNIINYTVQDDYILDDVGILVTYEGNLDKAVRICEAVANRVLKNRIKGSPKKPYVRVQFQGSGIDIKTRYYIKAEDKIEAASDVTKEINREFKKHRDVKVAYPHTEIVLKKKPPKF